MQALAIQADTAGDRDTSLVMGVCYLSRNAFRKGVASLQDWGNLSDMVRFAMAVDGLDAAHPMREHFAAADCALDAIYHRLTDTGAWRRHPVPHLDELDLIQEAIELADYLLQVTSPAGLLVARRSIQRDLRASVITSNRPTTAATPLPTQEILL